MNSISFDNVWLLFIAVPLIVLFSVPFAIAVRKENRNGHNIASQILHVVMAIIIGFAAAGPSVTSVLTETDVYVVADVSYSAKRNLDKIDAYIKNLKLPGNSKLGLVCFGKNCDLISELGNPKRVASVKMAEGIDDTETNIAEALLYTGELFTENVIKRVVLITDGKQSDLSNDTAIRDAVISLATKDITVDAIFLDDNPTADSKEVQISGVTHTQNAYLDSDQQAILAVQSSYETPATIYIKRNGESLSPIKVDLSLGLNSVGIALDTSTEGTFDYEVSISAEGDLNDKNNGYFFTQTVSSEMKVLVITENFYDCYYAAERYGAKGELDIYENDKDFASSFKPQLMAEFAGNPNIRVHLNTDAIPYTLEELCEYDQIVLADVDIGHYEECSSAFISNLDIAVANYGKSLITFGNLHVQNSEEYELQQLAGMLPVRFGNNDSKLYTVIIDTSRSMYTNFHLALAKQLTTRILNTLEDDAYITVITFNSDAEVIQTVTPAYNREEVIEKVENLEMVQGTVLGAGLNRAKEYLEGLAYDDKQVLLITDGMSYSLNVEDDPVNVAAEMYASGIVTSVFDVGRQGDYEDGSNPYNEDYEEFYKMLTRVAKAGHGKHYYSNNLERLDEVTFGEMSDDMTLSVVERETTVSVQRLQRNDPVLEGIDALSLPNVNGYVYGSTKPGATTVLCVNHRRSEDSEYTTEKPLYAYRNYGYGRVSTFMTSLGGDWVDDWQNAVGKAFFNNLFDVSIPAEKHTEPYSVNVVREGKVTRIELTVAETRLNTRAEITATLPNGQTLTEEKPVNGSSCYFELPTADLGKYSIGIAYKYDGQEYTCDKTVYVCYLEEYNAFGVYESSPLHRAIDGISGRVVDEGDLAIDISEEDVGRYVVELAPPLLITAVVMFVADIAIRKLRLDDIKSFFGIGKKEREGRK